MDSSHSKHIAPLEALLFIHGEPIGMKKIAAVLEIDILAAEALVGEYVRSLEHDARGLSILRDKEKVQLVTKPSQGKLLEAFIKEEVSEDLSPASLETLAIILYFGPVSRNRIEYIRGVNSSFIVRSLLVRGLVERFSDPKNPGAYVYRSSFDLFKHLGIQNERELPQYERFADMLKKFESTPDPGLTTAVQ